MHFVDVGHESWLVKIQGMIFTIDSLNLLTQYIFSKSVAVKRVSFVVKKRVCVLMLGGLIELSIINNVQDTHRYLAHFNRQY